MDQSCNCVDIPWELCGWYQAISLMIECILVWTEQSFTFSAFACIVTMMESVEAICSIAHVASEDEIRGLFQRLPSKARRSLGREVGIVSCERAIRKNPDVGVSRAFLEQREIQENVNKYVPDKSSGITLLHSAVLRPDGGEIVKMLLGLPGVDLDVVAYRGGLTPLHLACLLSRYEIVGLLLNDRRVDLSAKTLDCQTALHCACGALRDRIESEITSLGPTCKKVVHILLEAAAKSTGSLMRFLNERDSCGRTALHFASENNHRAIVEEIFNSLMLITGAGIESPDNAMPLTSGADEHLGYAVALARDSKGRMPVHLAAQQGHREVVSLLLRRAPHTFYSKDGEGFTPFHHCIRGGHLQIVEDLMVQYIRKSDSEWLEQKIVKTFVELLKITTHDEVAFFLLKELDQQLQASSLTRRKLATSLFHWAIVSNSGYGGILISQILKWQPTLANQTLEQQREQTLLHVATISGQLDVVEALCTEEGWTLRANKKDIFNKTALDYAHKLGHKDICEHLMQRSDVKEFLSKLQDEQNAYVTAANAILVVAVLIAGAFFASCIKRQDTWAQTPSDILSLYIVASATFMSAITATILGACASLPFSFGLYIGKHVKRCDYIGHKVARSRVLVALASYFLLFSLATMVFSFLCSAFGAGAPGRTRLLACTVFTRTLASITLLVFVIYISRALYCKVKQLTWLNWESSEVPLIVL